MSPDDGFSWHVYHVQKLSAAEASWNPQCGSTAIFTKAALLYRIYLLQTWCSCISVASCCHICGSHFMLNKIQPAVFSIPETCIQDCQQP